ncbi:MAG: hypothetical protein BMS9Abin23_1118 [Thermodesulfobacteriota bacterium]|nr:MAG: hypothetical protein BMS9Abin23_1118 [Thermodesulfobacteriota bacterium]
MDASSGKDISTKDPSYFSAICIERCGGACCDPWWGIISYTVEKRGGLSNLSDFRRGLLEGLRKRERRIVEAYVTREDTPRPLFSRPEKYNLIIKEIRADGATLHIGLIAMFAFRCRFLSPENSCTVHPYVIGGADIRPTHCGYLGLPDVKPGEKGYCRIIHSAQSPHGDDASIERAMEVERAAAAKHLSEGLQSDEEVVDRVINRIKDYCADNLKYLLPLEKEKTPGRNDPCTCGSGKKFKKCHGR